jgi:chemotaxis protein MotB
MLEETKEGLNIEIVDQDGRSMFPDAAKEPFEHTRKLIQKIAPQLKAMPYRLSIVGHTLQARCRLSSAMGLGNCLPIVRTPYARFWMAEGVPSGNIYMVAGKADTDPLFPDDPYMSPNRRVTITLMREEPPLPDNLTLKGTI